MKFKLLLSTFALMATSLIFMSHSGGRAASGNGDSTGAPSSGAFCQSCHSAGTFNPTVAIEVFDDGTTNAVTEYVPGNIYDLKITISNDGSPAGWGQQTTILDASDNPVTGTFSSPSSNAQISTLGTTGRDYFEHLGTSNTNEFTVKWTAPVAGTGAITFYTGANAVDGGSSTAGDGATKGSLSLTENTASSLGQLNKLAVVLKAFPNPVEEMLNLETIGVTEGSHALTITNMAGQVVLQKQLNLNFGADLTQINVSDLAQGLYQVVLSQDGKVASLSILKK